jgi:hypothetical protein
LIPEQDSNNNEQQQLQGREFSSIFAFKIKRKRSSISLLPYNNFHSLPNLITSNGFKFESEAYQSGFGKPTMFDKKILVAPYYDIIEERIIEDTTNKDKPGEIKQETKILPTQKVRYI